MESLEIIQIAVKERVLIVPLNFQGYAIPLSIGAIEASNMVYLVGDRLAWLVIDGLLDCKGLLQPAFGSKAIPKSLGALCFTPPDPMISSIGTD